MEFIQHTFNWIKGEKFEGILIGVFGLVTICIALFFWKLGTTPNAKALPIPLLIVGLLSTGTGISMYFSKQKRLIDCENNYQQDEKTFVILEKKRFEGFMYIYTLSNILVTVFSLFGIATIWLTKNHDWHTVGIAMVLMALSFFVIDYFSKESADTYYTKIENELKVF